MSLLDSSELRLQLACIWNWKIEANFIWAPAIYIWHLRSISHQAFAAASTMSDHYWIQTGNSVLLSETDLLSCCKTCGHGCQGGWDIQSWDYWNKTGLVTGSGQDCEGCRCYPFMKCRHHGSKGDYPQCPKELYSTPECENKCHNGYSKKFADDKIFGE